MAIGDLFPCVHGLNMSTRYFDMKHAKYSVSAKSRCTASIMNICAHDKTDGDSYYRHRVGFAKVFR